MTKVLARVRPGSVRALRKRKSRGGSRKSKSAASVRAGKRKLSPRWLRRKRLVRFGKKSSWRARKATRLKSRRRLKRRIAKKRIRKNTPVLNMPPVQEPTLARVDVPRSYEPVAVEQTAVAESRPKLSVIAPILNEEKFLPLFLESVSSYADEILIVDGGSTDNSISIINDWKSRANIRLFHIQQSGLPYSDDWNESLVRNFLVDHATGDWVMAIDADEMMDDSFREHLPAIMARKDIDSVSFPWVQFWSNPSTLRVNADGDERWSVNKLVMWRNHIGIRYDDAKNHCKPQWNGRYMWEYPGAVEPFSLYHYHYAFGSRVKENDNRRRDMDQYLGKPVDKIEYAINTTSFTASHPGVMQKYFSEHGEQMD